MCDTGGRGGSPIFYKNIITHNIGHKSDKEVRWREGRGDREKKINKKIKRIINLVPPKK